MQHVENNVYICNENTFFTTEPTINQFYFYNLNENLFQGNFIEYFS